MDDVLSDIFRRIQLKSCVYFKNDFAAPWGMEIESPGLANFHVVTRGRCVLQTSDNVYEGSAGDVFLLPRGAQHVLADQSDREAVAGTIFMQSMAKGEPLFSHGESVAQLICGHYEYHSDPVHPLLAQLPEVIHLKSFEANAPGAISMVLPMLISELNDDRPGVVSIIERLAEILLIQVLRTYLDEQAQPEGFLAALADSRLIKAIRLMHSQTSQSHDLERLAQTAGMSRSAFALHFKTTTGLSPGAYLTQWRIFRACELLRGNKVAIIEVAEQVGYESEVSFSRAFKRLLDITPAEYRRSVVC